MFVVDEIVYNNGQMVFGIGESTYQEVLDDFPNADYIGIITFNVTADPKKSSTLLDKVKSACASGAEVVLVTNIPKRWNNYWYDNNREQAYKAIGNYVDKLNPDKYGGKMTTYFCFENHAKIIMTNHIMYVGSANFSDESNDNWECGVITTDKDAIDKVWNVIFPEIINQSYPYFGKKIAGIAFEIKKASDLCKSFRKELFDASFTTYSDYETGFEERWVFDSENSAITAKMLSTFYDSFAGYEETIAGIGELVDNYEFGDNPSDEIIELQECYEAYHSFYDEMMNRINDAFDDLNQLAHYDCSTEANRILDTDFGMESFDENLDYYMSISMAEAQSGYTELIEMAEPSIRNILDDLKEMIEFFEKMSQRLKAVLEVRRRIDNTGLIVTSRTL